jgi:hypothetical protein
MDYYAINIHTEEEACKLICFEKILSSKDRACIVSSCMAWRWTIKYDDDWGVIEPTHGFCGLAGKPI